MTKRILLVDDDRLILTTLEFSLKREGYDVLSTTSGEEAIRMCEQEIPDLAVLDMSMPGLTGIDVARHLRQASEVPFIFLSAYQSSEVVEAAVKEGALGFVVKPIDAVKLMPPIEAALARAKDLKKLKKITADLRNEVMSRRKISMVTGLLMERYHLDEEAAFDVLRSTARAERRNVAEVASDIARAFNTLNIAPNHKHKPAGKPAE